MIAKVNNAIKGWKEKSLKLLGRFIMAHTFGINKRH
jgi:hypothetical protein